MGRQVQLAEGCERYDPLVRFGGLPCFPATPVLDQLDAGAELRGQPLESHFCEWPDAERLVLRDGIDYDVLVFGISLGMVPFVCPELLDDRREWRAMVNRVKTTATQAVQLWLREDEARSGGPIRGRPSARMRQPRYTPGRRCRS